MKRFIHNLFLGTNLISFFPIFFFASLMPEPLANQEVQGKIVARIPFKISNGLILLSVKINNSKPLKMFLDTGMSAEIVVLFHKESLEELGVQNTQEVNLGGAGSSEYKKGFMAMGAKVVLSNLEMTNQTIIIMDDSRSNSEWQIDGIIGRTIFDIYITVMDYENSILTLYENSNYEVNTSTVPIPLSFFSGIPIIDAKVNIEGEKEIPVKLVVDLGHRNALYFHEDTQKRILPPPKTINSIAGRGLQGVVKSKVGRIFELKAGNNSFRNVPTSFIEAGTNLGLSKNIVDGNLGSLIHNRFTMILDYPNKQMYLIPNKNYNKSFEFDMAGLVLEQNRDGSFYVQYVLENSPASENDIRKSDKIIKINGKDIHEYDYNKVYELLRQDSKEISLTIERENRQLIEKILRLSRLI